jgi:hypothetical protein
MELVDTVATIFGMVTREPTMTMFLVSMGVVGFALYVLLQAIKKKS